MTTAFVTGATGFLGRHLCQALHERGVKVHTYRRDAGDLRASLVAANPDWIFHLAADTRHTNEPNLLAELRRANVEGTRDVLTAARSVALRAFVGVGSFEEYGDNPIPFLEEMPARPRSPYGVSKAEATRLILEAAQTGLPAAVVRFPVIYGPGQSTETFVGGACAAICGERKFAMTPGQQTRDFLHVSDAVSALLVVAEQIGACRGEILNASSGVALSLRDAVAIIGQAAGRADFAEVGVQPYRPDEQMHYVGDSTKIRKLIGWSARTSFLDGIRETLAKNLSGRPASR